MVKLTEDHIDKVKMLLGRKGHSTNEDVLRTLQEEGIVYFTNNCRMNMNNTAHIVGFHVKMYGLKKFIKSHGLGACRAPPCYDKFIKAGAEANDRRKQLKLSKEATEDKEERRNKNIPLRENVTLEPDLCAHMDGKYFRIDVRSFGFKVVIYIYI